MKKQLLLGIDDCLSLPTQQALGHACDLLTCTSSEWCVLLLHVIAAPYAPPRGKLSGPPQRLPPTRWQRLQAERILSQAHHMVQEWGVAPERIETLQRAGIPADELVSVARERDVDCIVVGTHGNSFAERLRRLLLGSTSRRVMSRANCPVMIVGVATPTPRNLIAWYQEAIVQRLQKENALVILTPHQVAVQFAPSSHEVERKEIAAATAALDQLTQQGRLCRHRVGNDVHYVND